MLEGLDEIEWGELTHAYGTAEETPQLLRELLHPSEDKRAAACDRILCCLYHQGSVYEATGLAVPFLIEMLRAPATPDRAMVLEILYLFATGGGWHEAHQGLALMKERSQTQEYQDAIDQEAEWVEAIGSAIRQHHPLYLELLADPDQSVRLQAANLVGYLAREPEASRAALVERFTAEESEQVRAALVAALSRVKAEPQQLQELLQQESSPLPRLLLAQALLLGEKPAQMAADEVWGALERGQLLQDYHQLPNVSDFYGDLALALFTAFPDRRQSLLKLLLEVMRPLTFCSDWRAIVLLTIAAGGQPFAEQQLEPLQKEAIATVARLTWPRPQTTDANMAGVLRSFELPVDQKELASLLGVEQLFEQASPERPWWKFWV